VSLAQICRWRDSVAVSLADSFVPKGGV